MLVKPRREFPALLLKVRGTALAQIWPLLVVAGLVSWGLSWLHERFELHWIELTLAPFTLVGLALSIFLGFRNSACYERWWEGRKLWGRLVNTSRSYARQVLTLVRSDDPAAAALHRELVDRHAAYVHALRLHLREQRTWEELAPFLPAGELDALRTQRNVPYALTCRQAERHREAMDRGWLDPFHLPVLEAALTDLLDIQGGCERIKNTPVPLAYTELTHRIVALYVLCLPFGVIDTVGALTPVVVVMVAFCFLGLDAVGSQIENPFEEDPNDLPLSQLSRMIENDVRQRVGHAELRPDVQPERGILL
ncbi:MAG: bestrophin family ion channel [Myxococcota bacterium]